MATSSLPSAAQVFRIKNSTPTEQLLWIEPLGHRIAVRSNVLYELLGSDELGRMEIELADDGFVVHGWLKRVTARHDNGTETVEWQLPD